MKNLTTALALFISFSAFAQKLPSIKLKNIDGKVVSTDTLSTNDNTPDVIIFWATWHMGSKNLLLQVDKEADKWQSTLGAKVIIVSIDDVKTMGQVEPYLKNKGWDFEALLDPSHDFKKAMKVDSVPHVFVLNGNGNIAWQTAVINNSTVSEIAAHLKNPAPKK